MRIGNLSLDLQLTCPDVLGGERIVEVGMDELLLLALQLLESPCLLGEKGPTGLEVLIDGVDGSCAGLSDLVGAEPVLRSPLPQDGAPTPT